MRITSLFSMNLSRLFHCSVIKVLVCCLCDSFYILSKAFVFVNNFFIFLCCRFKRQPVYLITGDRLCQQLFYFSLLLFQATACLSYHQRSALSTTFFFPSRSFSRTDCRIPCRLLSLLFFCMCRCIRVSPIVQYSPLLPPVGVWAVSQSQCGRSPSQAGY